MTGLFLRPTFRPVLIHVTYILDLSVANQTKIEINLTFFERRLSMIYSYSDAEY